MSKKGNTGDVLRYSVCNKSQRDVKNISAGPTVYICDECVDICLDIIAEDRKEEPGALEGTDHLPKPKEIKEFYMRSNDDERTVAAMDVLVPRIGEIIGGSQREERHGVLLDKIRAHAGKQALEVSIAD